MLLANSGNGYGDCNKSRQGPAKTLLGTKSGFNNFLNA